MISSLVLNILNFFDYFHKKKIKNFFKDNNFLNFNLIIDVGAHKGESITFFLENFNVKKIISFEPSPINFKILKENVKKFKSKFNDSSIILENLGLGSKENVLKLKQHFESSSSTIIDIKKDSNYLKKKNKFLNLKTNIHNLIDIKVITLSSYLEKKDIKDIDLIKIDTEGYEFKVLLGLNDAFRNVKCIMFEHHYDDMLQKKYTFSDIHKLLKDKKFKQIFKIKMPFRKTIEYVYINEQ
tara:strand:- start:72 stop:791 length:720 start_codon:yes stop_codon:yes gene_type:complete